MGHKRTSGDTLIYVCFWGLSRHPMSAFGGRCKFSSVMSAFGGKADVNQLATGEAFEGIDFGGSGTPSGVCPLPYCRKLIWRFLNLVPPQIPTRPRFNLKKNQKGI